MRPTAGLLLALPLTALVAACGDPCPEGYVQDDVNKECNPEGGGDGATGDGGDGSTDGDADTDADADADSDADTDADSDADADADADLPEGAHDGALITTDGLIDAKVQSWSAFSYTGTAGGEDVALVYMSSTPGLSCTEVANYLGAVEGPVDPTALYTRETCNLLIQLRNIPGTVSEAAPIDLSSVSIAIITAACPSGDGSFVLQSLDGGLTEGYVWLDGDAADAIPSPWLTAAADAGAITAVAISGDAVRLDLEIDSYRGSYPITGGGSLARGTGKGTIDATACAALGSTPFFDGP